jgi:hypothetical protein
MSIFRRKITATAALVTLAAALGGSLAEARSVVRQETGVAPYCVLIGAPRGAALPQICRFFGYQQCLQAAADWRGNCVANIDYRGPPPDTTGATWARGAR